MPMTLKAARTNAGLNQKQAAKCIGVSVSTIHKWESGKAYPTAKKIPQITKAYHCTYDDIIFLPAITL